MALAAIWRVVGNSNEFKEFSKSFKIQRGRNSDSVYSVANEQCYGVLSCETNGSFKVFSEVVAPVLSLEMARAAVRVLERKLPGGGVGDWEEIESELRARGYRGKTICPYSLPDATGFFIMEQVFDCSPAVLEEAGEGFIENYLTNRGYTWLADERAWQNPCGAVCRGSFG